MSKDLVTEALERLAGELGTVEVFDGDAARCPVCALTITEAA